LALIASLPIAGVMMWLLGVFRRGSINGPSRVGARESFTPILVITFLGGCVWFFSQLGFGVVKGFQFHHDHPGESFDLDKLTSGDFAFLSTVPAAIGFAFLIVGDVAAGQKLPRRLGYSIGRLPVGVIAGVLGA